MQQRSVMFKGSQLSILGQEIKAGDKCPAFKLTATDMSDIDNSEFQGKILIISVAPSLDTPVCSTQTKKFNAQAATLSDNVKILTVSRDLPFAQKRWCAAEGVEDLVLASDYKYQKFGQDFGVLIQEWGLLARAVFVVNSDQTVRYVEYVPEVSSEPNYDGALTAVRELIKDS